MFQAAACRYVCHNVYRTTAVIVLLNLTLFIAVIMILYR